MTINPELLLAAGRLAFPDYGWILSARPSMQAAVVAYVEFDNDAWIQFDPIKNPADHDALVQALEMEGWEFYYIAPLFLAYHMERQIEACDRSWAMRSIKCVAFQTGIPLEVK